MGYAKNHPGSFSTTAHGHVWHYCHYLHMVMCDITVIIYSSVTSYRRSTMSCEHRRPSLLSIRWPTSPASARISLRPLLSPAVRKRKVNTLPLPSVPERADRRTYILRAVFILLYFNKGVIQDFADFRNYILILPLLNSALGMEMGMLNSIGRISEQ